MLWINCIGCIMTTMMVMMIFAGWLADARQIYAYIIFIFLALVVRCILFNVEYLILPEQLYKIATIIIQKHTRTGGGCYCYYCCCRCRCYFRLTIRMRFFSPSYTQNKFEWKANERTEQNETDGRKAFFVPLLHTERTHKIFLFLLLFFVASIDVNGWKSIVSEFDGTR